MARRRQPNKENVPPTISPQQAIPLIRRQVERLQEIMELHYNDPAVNAWESTTEEILNGVYGLPDGEPDRRTRDFKYVQSGEPISIGMTDAEIQRDHVLRQQKRKALLEAYIGQLEILVDPAVATVPGEYRFHPEIDRVSGKLFHDGHYKAAAFEAYIRVIEEVKARSELTLDGDSLMNHAFGSEARRPVIQFNGLETDAERDEQRGIMYLFKGIVQLRNSKAHSNRLFDDVQRAHEYLALASLLLRLLEIATVNPVR